jgi:hypothetical protein
MDTKTQTEFLISHAVDCMTEFLVADRHISIAEALRLVYHSQTYQKLLNLKTGFYFQSPSYVYEYLTMELADPTIYGQTRNHTSA